MMASNELPELRYLWNRIDALKAHNQRLRTIVLVQLALIATGVILICLSSWDSLFAK